MVRPIPGNQRCMLIPTPHSLTVTMMSRITLHLKRFGHRTTIIDSDEMRQDPRHPLPPAVRPWAPPLRVHGAPGLETSPRFAFPSGWSTSTPASPDTVPTGQSFELEPLSAAATGAPVQQESIDLDVLRTLNSVGDEELAGSHGEV
jgi:hypothetical protein